MLPAFPFWLAFFDKCRHAFLLIVGGKQQSEQPPFKQNTFVQRRLKGLIHGFFGHAQGNRRFGGDGCGDFDATVRNWSTGATRLTSPNRSASSAVSRRSERIISMATAFADRPCQALRAACAGNDAQVDLRLPEHG